MLKLFIATGLGAGLWVGIQAEQAFHKTRCENAGGTVNEASLCVGNK
ncbi:MAG: hypothetical protein ACPGVK_05330 [Halocynthiibacter sp.]